MNRLVYKMPKPGSIDALQLQEEELGAPGPDEVTVKVHAVGLNFADIFTMHGLYKAAPDGPIIPGLECSGEIVAVGGEVEKWKVGDRVMGATKFGGYVSHINSHQRYVVPFPDEWNYAQAAGFLVQGLTAYYALTQLGNVQEGMTVLIHSAAGGVGIQANRICKKFGAHTIGTVGRPEKIDFLQKEESYDEVIMRDGAFPEKLNRALGDRPLRLVMECIGGKILKQGWKALAPMGRMVVYGSASFTSHGSRANYLKLLWKYLRRPKIDPLRLPTQNKSLMGFNLIYLYEETELMHRLLDELHVLDLPPQHIGHVFDFEELHEAIRLFQQGKTVGKVVLTMDN